MPMWPHAAHVQVPAHEAAAAGKLDALKALHTLGCSFDVVADNGQSVLDAAKGDPSVRCVLSV